MDDHVFFLGHNIYQTDDPVFFVLHNVSQKDDYVSLYTHNAYQTDDYVDVFVNNVYVTVRSYSPQKQKTPEIIGCNFGCKTRNLLIYKLFCGAGGIGLAPHSTHTSLNLL